MAYADALTALADPTRRHIFEALRGGALSVTELARTQPVSRPAVSQHLRVLEAARLVHAEARGSHRIYAIRRDGLEDLRRYLEGFWSDVLAAYGDEIAAATTLPEERTMLEPVVARIEVPCSPERAFDVFVGGMGGWWPLDRRSMSMKNGQPAKALTVDAREGGRIVEIAGDGTEHHWGTIRTLSPHDFVAMDFHMGMPPEQASLVEVRFTPVAGNRTEVVLTQSNWEAFGDMAEMLRGHYGSSWSLIFEDAYARACTP